MARHSVLSRELLSALNIVGAKLREGSKPGRELEVALSLLSGLEPGHVARADGEIADAAGLHRHPPQPPIRRLLSRQPSGAEQLLALPGLEYLFLFHHDGGIRESALLKITGGFAAGPGCPANQPLTDHQQRRGAIYPVFTSVLVGWPDAAKEHVDV